MSNQESGGLQVSVVMAVFNGERTLEATLRSVLQQTDCYFEFIVVNDGSTDATPDILARHAVHDKRLRVVHQENTGLTRALIAGCGLARAPFIARQDCGDLSLPGRLSSQFALMSSSSAVMVAGGVRVIAPDGETVNEVACTSSGLCRGLNAADAHTVAGPPHHGATMFRRDSYIDSGGYRATFPVAQDIDLWLRLIDRGDCIGQDQIVYVAALEQGSISDTKRDKQLHYAALAVRSRDARRATGSDGQVFASTSTEFRPDAKPQWLGRQVSESRFFYFVGACLRKRDPVAARKYFLRAIRANPLHLRALIRAFGF